MSNIDQFESMFRSAEREPFQYRAIDIRSVLIVSDRDAATAEAFEKTVRDLLKSVIDGRATWRHLHGEASHVPLDIIAAMEAGPTDLICTYRNLHSAAWRSPYSLGTHLDLLTQHTAVPVLVLPHPEAPRTADHVLEDFDRVMAITDHLAGDHRLVNFAVRFTERDGTLWLTHVEDEQTFDRYMDAISKIPAIDTGDARAALAEQLLKEPQDFVRGCAEVLRKNGVPIAVEDVVAFGHHLEEYERLVNVHRVDLLVMNTKDDDQLAMHGMAHELAVEMRHVPILMV